MDAGQRGVAGVPSSTMADSSPIARERRDLILVGERYSPSLSSSSSGICVTREVEESRLTSQDCPFAMRDSSAIARPARWSHSSFDCGCEVDFTREGLREAIGDRVGRPAAFLVCEESKAEEDFAFVIGALGSCSVGK